MAPDIRKVKGMPVDPTPEVHPVQKPKRHSEQGYVPTVVTLMAYEVYCHVYAPQAALIEGGCRGGFGVCELIALLYARNFPKTEWKSRVDEAFKGMELR